MTVVPLIIPPATTAPPVGYSVETLFDDIESVAGDVYRLVGLVTELIDEIADLKAELFDLKEGGAQPGSETPSPRQHTPRKGAADVDGTP